MYAVKFGRNSFKKIEKKCLIEINFYSLLVRFEKLNLFYLCPVKNGIKGECSF